MARRPRARVHFAWLQPSLIAERRRYVPSCSCGWTGPERAKTAAAWVLAAVHQRSVRGIAARVA